MVDACLQLFDQLHRRFFYKKGRTKVPTQEDRNFVIAACRSWFDEYRKGLLSLGVEEKFILEIDKLMKSLLSAANSSKRRLFYRRHIGKISKILDKFLVDAQVAEWNIKKKDSPVGDVGDLNIRNALKNFNPDLERRYLQVIYDLQDIKRVSYAGTANELREIIRIVLLSQAPDKEVIKKNWFKGFNGKPTQVERVKFILEKRRAGDKEIRNAQDTEELIDGLFGKVVRSSYGKINASVHGKKNRGELISSLRYVHAFLWDILPI